MTRTTIFLITSFLIIGCVAPKDITIPYLGTYHKSPRIIIKKKYITTAKRKKVDLPKIESYLIEDIHSFDKIYFKVNKKELAKSAKICQEKTVRIEFYESIGI